MVARRSIRTWLLVVALAAGSLTCGGDISAPPEPDPAAAVVQPVAGDGQVGVTGQPLMDSLVVRVEDAHGQPMEGVSVAWATGGGGSVSGPGTTTGSDGRAAVQRVLGGTVGRQTTTAVVSNLPPAVFTAIATVQISSVQQLVITTQPSSEAESGVALAQQPVLRLENSVGQPGSGIQVTASVEGATLSGTSVVESDTAGVVRFSDLALSGPLVSYQLTFSAPDLVAVRSEAITLSAGPAGQIVILTQPPSSTLDHDLFAPAQQPVVLVTDGAGNPVAQASVMATVESGGGSLEGRVTATSGTDGRAAFGDLSIGGAGLQAIRFSVGSIAAVSNQVSVAALPAEATTGQWGPVIDWSANGADIVPVHLTLLPTGKLLAWGRMGQPWVWTPPADGNPSSAGTFREFPVDTMIFCSGHALLADGRLLVAGGHLDDDRGLEVTHIFDPFAERWSAKGELPDMARGRWYPTITTLADGRAVTVAGRDTAGTVVTVPELWDGTSWIKLTGASRGFPYYPRNFVAPNGRVFYAGERVQSWWLDVDANVAAGRGRWTAGPSHLWPFNRDYGSAVMYEPGKILFVGGGGDPSPNPPRDTPAAAPTNTAEIIDLNQPSPSWSSTGSMAFARRHLNATVLPDGQVLATGGVSGAGFNAYTTAVHAAELWSPGTGAWTTLASNVVDRAYHAVALLLPNGTVLAGASGDASAPRETSHEIFSPPYLFKGTRPTITSAPAIAGYGQIFDVESPYAAQITKVSLVRLGSVTHGFDQNTRFLALPFSAGAGRISITAPLSPNLAPPGHYMMFVLNRNGVPSDGKIIQLQ